jgi:hypothetical protein
MSFWIERRVKRFREAAEARIAGRCSDIAEGGVLLKGTAVIEEHVAKSRDPRK